MASPITGVSLAKASVAGSSKYPSNLSQDRYLTIGVWDTSKNDPNQLISDIASSAARSVKEAAFGSATGTAVPADAAPSLTKSIDNAWNGAGGIAKQYYNNNISKGNFGNPSLDDGGIPVWKYNFYLPLPNEIQEALSHDFTSQGGLVDQAAELLTSIPGISKLSGLSDTAGKISNMASLATGSQAWSYYDNKVLKYTSSDFRSLDCSWTMIANNQAEAKTIQEIILQLKAFSSPESRAGKLMVQAPHFFSLTFNNKVIDDALQFKEVVITGLSVNYSTNSDMQLFVDEMPKTINLSITFKDREPKLANTWNGKDVGIF